MSKTWTNLRDELAAIYKTGEPVPGAYSDLGTDEPVRFYPPNTANKLKHWLHEAHQLAINESRETLVTDLANALQASTKQLAVKNLYDAKQDLSLSDFSRIIEMDDEDEDDISPLDTRYRFDWLICNLLRIAEFASSLGTLKPDTKQEYWTREELAAFRGVKPETITKQVIDYRKKNGRDPIWLRREPGRQRGFIVKVDTYFSEQRAGTVH